MTYGEFYSRGFAIDFAETREGVGLFVPIRTEPGPLFSATYGEFYSHGEPMRIFSGSWRAGLEERAPDWSFAAHVMQAT
jgi:hypothetical protein